jgi:hypothetical protein
MAKHSAASRLASGSGLVAVLLVVLLGTGAILWLTRGHDPLTRPDDTCASAPPLRTVDGVTLQPAAMKAFRMAQHRVHDAIAVVQSYRSCGQQAEACTNICGNANGCPGTCASPGASYHQLGAAVDITQGSLDTPGVIAALQHFGWCESEPNTDPGHFSFDGCH